MQSKSTITAKEYLEMLNKKRGGGRKNTAGGAGAIKNNDTTKLEEITRRLGLATGTASMDGDGCLQFSFHSAPLASLNILLGAHFIALHRYRNAWHDLVFEAYSKLGFRVRVEEPVNILVTRVAPRLLDTDNVIAKAAIDGLRYCGVLRDDSPEHLFSVKTSQEVGDEMVVLTVRPLS